MVSAVAFSQIGFERLSKQAAAARDADHDVEAIQLYTQALKLRPAWNEGLWHLGTLLYRQERFLEARDVLRRSAAQEHGMARTWALLGMSEYQTREYSRALAHLTRALSLGLAVGDPLRRSAVYETAALLTRSERYDEALALLMEMAAAEPASAPLAEAAGLAGLRLPMLPMEIAPDRREMVRLAGAAICELGAHRRAEAAVLMKQLVDGYSEEPGVHFLYGASLMDDDPEKGVAEMRRELAITPGHVPARVRLASEYLKAGEAEKAKPVAEEAVSLDPKSAGARLVWGRVLTELDRLPEGIRELEAARDLAPADASTRWALATAYARAGREADAARERAETRKLKDR
jgi:predicted Zn-dependent protease